MITPEIITNINKVDFDLKSLFENVKISEVNRGKQFFFEIVSSTSIKLNESGDTGTANVIVRISKSDLLGNFVRWYYSINPLNENARWIERASSITTIGKDIWDIVNKKMMESEYFNSLEPNATIENTQDEAHVETTVGDKILEIAYCLGVETTGVELDENYLLFEHEGEIKMSTKFEINRQISLLSEVVEEGVVFHEGYFKVYLK